MSTLRNGSRHRYRAFHPEYGPPEISLAAAAAGRGRRSAMLTTSRWPYRPPARVTRRLSPAPFAGSIDPVPPVTSLTTMEGCRDWRRRPAGRLRWQEQAADCRTPKASCADRSCPGSRMRPGNWAEIYGAGVPKLRKRRCDLSRAGLAAYGGNVYVKADLSVNLCLASAAT